MVALAYSFSLFVIWTLVGRALVAVAAPRWGVLRPWLISPGLGLSVFLLAVMTLNQLGLPIAQPSATAAGPAENKTILQGIEAENRQKLWRWFITATLALLLMETALAGWTTRRSTLQSEEVAS